MNANAAQPVIVRNALSADRGEVARLFSQHLADLGLHPDPVLDADMARFSHFYEPPRGFLLLAVDADGRVVGMAALLGDEIRRVYS